MNVSQPSNPNRKGDPVLNDIVMWCMRCIFGGAMILVTLCILAIFLFLFKHFIHFLG